MKTVWILGAGFSKPLGGPLLTELFDRTRMEFVISCFPDFLGKEWCGSIVSVFQEFSVNQSRSPVFWNDAEEFLDKLDAASGLTHTHPELKQMQRCIDQAYGDNIPDLLKHVSDQAVSLMCAECSAFVKYGIVNSERWKSHVEWVKRVCPTDTIITFNYDTLVEKLDKEVSCQENERTRVQVILPGSNSSLENCTPMYKLHGSVDWEIQQLQGKKCIRQSRNGYWAILLESVNGRLIASPGPSKVEHTKVLKELWDGAAGALHEANRIVFVGYRIPETDGFARHWFLEHLTAIKDKNAQIDIVLGPDVGSPAVQRLLALLKTTRTTTMPNVHAVPMYSQDYLAAEAIRRKQK
jgi:hypothetical protein